MPIKSLPYFTSGEVIKGFGRGSKQLGIPTANFPSSVINELPEEIKTGVYYGYASVNKGEVHKMVMSIGWNPYFQNIEKSMETHIMHDFAEDFYGQQLYVVMLGYLRPQKDFTTVDELIATINQDIAIANEKLDLKENLKYKENSFFK